MLNKRKLESCLTLVRSLYSKEEVRVKAFNIESYQNIINKVNIIDWIILESYIRFCDRTSNINKRAINE